MLSSPARFVADTHALWWYLWSRERLTPAASAVFRLAETGAATIVVPAIVVAELYFLSVKLGQTMTPSQILEALAGVGGIELSDLGRAQLERLDRLPEIPEIQARPAHRSRVNGPRRPSGDAGQGPRGLVADRDDLVERPG